MKYAILSDIHANEIALEAVLADARRFGAEKFVSLGDVVGYGPSPSGALKIVRSEASVSLLGNHDAAVAGMIDAGDFIDLASDAVSRHREQLSEDDLAWLKTLAPADEIEGALIAHGDFISPETFEYVDTCEAAAAEFAACHASLMFVGHTHVPCIFLVGESGQVHRLEPQDFTLEEGKRYIVNPGSVGYPRESGGKCYSSYILYDSEARTVVFRMLPFSVSSVMQRGRNRHFPSKSRLAVIGVAIAVVAAIAAYLFSSREEVVEVVENVTIAEDPALELVRKSITLPTFAGQVTPALELAKGSSPVLIRIEFRGARGEVLEPLAFTVKGSLRRWFAVPSGAVSVDFIIRRPEPSSEPVIKRFAPNSRAK